jgi:hypothetical protein
MFLYGEALQGILPETENRRSLRSFPEISALSDKLTALCPITP